MIAPLGGGFLVLQREAAKVQGKRMRTFLLLCLYSLRKSTFSCFAYWRLDIPSDRRIYKPYAHPRLVRL